MDVRPRGRKLPFELLADESIGENVGLLSGSQSAAITEELADDGVSFLLEKKRKRKRKSKGSKLKDADAGDSIDATATNRSGLASGEVLGHGVGADRAENLEIAVVEGSVYPRIEPVANESLIGEIRPFQSICMGGVQTVCLEPSLENSSVMPIASVELRQRAMNGSHVGRDLDSNRSGGRSDAHAKEDDSAMSNNLGKWGSLSNGNARLETEKSLDWKTLTTDDSNYSSTVPVEKMPLQYFWGEIHGGNSLRITASVGNEKKRQRVYNTMFHVPWRCELLINVGFFVCLDSFLSLLTIMPARIIMTFWTFLNMRQFKKPCAADLSDFGCFVVLICGVTLLQAIDISLIYHIIRGQGTLKLYVVYNVLEIFDKLCQSFGGDVVQVLFNSAEGVANCSQECMTFELMRFILDQTIAVIAFIVHSFILLAQAITLSTCIVAHNNALLALLVSNNFAEIKSNVFKRLSKENLHMLVYYDTIERFHITAYIIFVLAQNILEAEGSWFGSFLTNAALVYMCEVVIDIIKHSFLAKFNDIKPEAYSEFLEALCKQTLNVEPEEGRKQLTFIPLAPACVVIRVLTPIYTAHLPYCPLWWRFFWICILTSLTYVTLVILKIMVGMGLRLHATWYIKRCLKKKQHLHFD
ncbi:protein POLLEN DEFECTIVE IN GUIDANCE 1 [Nymphaea colorata]|nr:protein POLLEN DEFECTIVE IN GUIDANCE 1 [Nymphaea colorata]